jgi:hypothetical protein
MREQPGLLACFAKNVARNRPSELRTALSGFWGPYGSVTHCGDTPGLAWAMLSGKPHPLVLADVHQDFECTAVVIGDFFARPSGSAAGIAGWLAGQLAMGTSLPAALAQLNGVFGGFVYDRRLHRLDCFCDPLGYAQLFWADLGEEVWLSSNLGAFRRLSAFHARFDTQAVVENLTIGYPLGNRTLLEGVRRVGPGAMVRCQSVGATESPWFEMPVRRSHQSLKTSAGQIVDAMDDHVRRLIVLTGGRLGLAASGGRDSRIVLNALSRNRAEASLFVMSDPNDRASADLHLARRLARREGLPLTEIHQVKGGFPQIDTNAALWTNGVWPAQEWMRFGEIIESHVDTVLIGINGDWMAGRHLPAGDASVSITPRGTLISDGRKFLCRDDLADYLRQPAEAAWDAAMSAWSEDLAPLPGEGPREAFIRTRLQTRGRLWLVPVVGQCVASTQVVSPYYDAAVMRAYLEMPIDHCVLRRAHTLATDWGYPWSRQYRVTSSFSLPPALIALCPLVQSVHEHIRIRLRALQNLHRSVPVNALELAQLFDTKVLLDHLPEPLFVADTIAAALAGRRPCSYRVIRKLFALACFHSHYIEASSADWPYPRSFTPPCTDLPSSANGRLLEQSSGTIVLG